MVAGTSRSIGEAARRVNGRHDGRVLPAGGCAYYTRRTRSGRIPTGERKMTLELLSPLRFTLRLLRKVHIEAYKAHGAAAARIEK